MIEVSQIVVHEARQPDMVFDLFDANVWPAKTSLRLIFLQSDPRKGRLPKRSALTGCDSDTSGRCRCPS